MMEEWKEYKLGDVLNFRRGHDLPKSAMKGGNIPVAGSNGIIGYHDVCTPISPCITIGRSGNTGTPYIYDKCWAHNTVLYIDDFKGNNPLYLYYLLKTLPLSSFSGGSAVPTLNRNHIHPLIIKHTSNSLIQQHIATILKSLDDKIEVNRKINENLEQQAQALFKYWFVDFEPFKDGEFVESELGMIPKGWRVVSFKNVCKNITDGVHNTVKDDLNGNYYLLSCKNIKGGYVSIGKDERRIDLITFEKLRKRTKLQKGDILLSSVGTIGEMVLLNEEPINYEFQRSVAIIKPNTEMISSEFLYYTMKNQKDVIIHSAHGAVQQCLFISDVANFITIYPPYEIIQRFTTIVRGLHNIITNNRQESRRLATLRDTLLPKLMSGEIKIIEKAL